MRDSETRVAALNDGRQPPDRDYCLCNTRGDAETVVLTTLRGIISAGRGTNLGLVDPSEGVRVFDLPAMIGQHP